MQEYDFTTAKRASDIPHLKKLQAEAKGKTRVIVTLDNNIFENYRNQAKQMGVNYQNLIDEVIRVGATAKS